MHPTFRPQLLVPLLALVAGVAPLISGCSGDAEDTGPTVVATSSPKPPTQTAPTQTAPTQTAPTQTAPTGSPSESASDVAAVCAPYSVMVDAIEDAALRSSDPEEIAAAIAPVMRRFAAQVDDFPKPPGMDPETWAGVQTLAHQIETLPAHPSSDDIEAVEEELSSADKHAVEAAAAWFRSSCGL